MRSERQTEKSDIARYLRLHNKEWVSSPSEVPSCDVCMPLNYDSLQEYLKTRDYHDPPWLCADHARELGVLW